MADLTSSTKLLYSAFFELIPQSNRGRFSQCVVPLNKV